MSSFYKRRQLLIVHGNIYVDALYVNFSGLEADEYEKGDVLSAQITTTNQSSTEIDDATGSPSKLWTDNKPVSRPPTKLKLIKYKKTSSWCYGVSWREDGNILCSTYTDGL